MKKRLEADLISIAHRILQLKDKSDVNQLYLETQQLYEKLSVLKFIEENYAETKPTIGSYSEIEKEIEGFYNKNTSLPVENIIETTESNELQETTIEEPINDIKAEVPEILEAETPEAVIEAEEIQFEELATIEEPVNDAKEEILATEIPEIVIETEEISVEEVITEVELDTEENNIEFKEKEPEIEAEKVVVTESIPEFKASFELEQAPELVDTKKPETVQISFEDLLGLNFNEPEFIKVEDIAASTKDTVVFEAIKDVETPIQIAAETSEKTITTPKKVSLNDKFSKGIDIDLNDRIAFVKHLFGNSNEDYNRVMNQLITYNNFFETKNFIDEMVKPDYNEWKGKEEYEERFIELIEKKFL